MIGDGFFFVIFGVLVSEGGELLFLGLVRGLLDDLVFLIHSLPQVVLLWPESPKGFPFLVTPQQEVPFLVSLSLALFF